MPLDGLKLQAQYLEAVRARPAVPYPVPPAVWLATLEDNAVAFLGNRLFGLPPFSRWTSRADAEATILHWVDTETDSDRDRERHDLFCRWMVAESGRRAEVWPEPPRDLLRAIDVDLLPEDLA